MIWKQYNTCQKPPTSKNTQTFGQIELEFKVLDNALNVSGVESIDFSNADIFMEYVTNSSFSVHSTFHSVHKSMSGTAIFLRDMIFDITFILIGMSLDNAEKI